jgi:hypothetical protein
VVTFRTHNYIIRHDLPSPLLQAICIDVAYLSSDLLNFLGFFVAFFGIWFNLITVQVEIFGDNIFPACVLPLILHMSSISQRRETIELKLTGLENSLWEVK